ncbi:hypothetical protein PRO82_001726 [Candidatus Protochlamydia amoebophila]|nr:hypothetical protein [Candidatus Protochlamydia amoebophila]
MKSRIQEAEKFKRLMEGINKKCDISKGISNSRMLDL